MKNKKHWKVELCERDKYILRDLFYSKGLDLEIILHRHFKGKNKSTALKRLSRLHVGHFLNKGGIIRNSKIKIIYTISLKGLNVIQDELSGQLIRKELKSSNIEHDLALAKIADRLLLARSLVEIKAENEIQSIAFGDYDFEYDPFRRLNTDIYFSFLANEREYKVAVEFERTEKSSYRWTKLLQNYHLEESIDIVFYVCKDKSMVKRMKQIEAELAKMFSGKIFFCTLDEFYSNKELVNFTNTIGHSFTLNLHS